MSQELKPETEFAILDALDREQQDSWLALVRWMAARMAEENPKLLVELIHRRAKLIVRQSTGSLDLSERFTILMADCGVRLAVVGEPREPEMP